MANVARQEHAAVEIVVKSFIFFFQQVGPFHEDVVFYIQALLKMAIKEIEKNMKDILRYSHHFIIVTTHLVINIRHDNISREIQPCRKPCTVEI